MRYHLRPLSGRETKEYIEKRLKVAGARDPLFTPKAVQEVYRSSGGIPRLINILCDSSLLNGFSSGRRSIGTRLVKEAAKDLKLKKKFGINWLRILFGVLMGACILSLAFLQESGQLGLVLGEALHHPSLKDSLGNWGPIIFR